MILLLHVIVYYLQRIVAIIGDVVCSRHLKNTSHFTQVLPLIFKPIVEIKSVKCMDFGWSSLLVFNESKILA